mgnify:CR=1 FL=1
MRTPPPLRGATPGAIGSGEGERSEVVGGEAERMGVLKVGFGFGYALELCVYWGRVGGVGAIASLVEERPIASLRVWVVG